MAQATFLVYHYVCHQKNQGNHFFLLDRKSNISSILSSRSVFFFLAYKRKYVHMYLYSCIYIYSYISDRTNWKIIFHLSTKKTYKYSYVLFYASLRLLPHPPQPPSPPHPSPPNSTRQPCENPKVIDTPTKWAFPQNQWKSMVKMVWRRRGN